MPTPYLTVNGFRTSLSVVVTSDESILTLTAHPFLSEQNAPKATLITRKSVGAPLTCKSSLMCSGADLMGTHATVHLQAAQAAFSQCLQWEAMAISMRDNPDDTAFELIRLANTDAWAELAIYAALLDGPLIPLDEKGRYNSNAPTDEQCHSLDSLFFRHPAFAKAKAVFMDVIHGRDTRKSKDLPAPYAHYLDTFYRVLDRFPMCHQKINSHYKVAAFLLAQNNIDGRFATVNHYYPHFLTDEGNSLSPESFLAWLYQRYPQCGEVVRLNFFIEPSVYGGKE